MGWKGLMVCVSMYLSGMERINGVSMYLSGMERINSVVCVSRYLSGMERINGVSRYLNGWKGLMVWCVCVWPGMCRCCQARCAACRRWRTGCRWDRGTAAVRGCPTRPQGPRCAVGVRPPQLLTDRTLPCCPASLLNSASLLSPAGSLHACRL